MSERRKLELEGARLLLLTFLEDRSAVNLEDAGVILVLFVVTHRRRSMPQAELHIMIV